MDENVAADDGDYAAGGLANVADYVAVVTVHESVAADEGNCAADGVANAADYVAVAQGTRADVVDSNCHGTAAAVQCPRGPTAAAVQSPRRSSKSSRCSRSLHKL